MNAATLALDSIARFGEYTALQYEGHSITNIEQQRHAARLAGLLRAQGVQPGDRVLTMMLNSPDAWALFQAAWMIGASIVPIAPQLKAPEVQYRIEHSGARLAITVPPLAPVFQAAPISRLLVVGAPELSAVLDSVAPVNRPVEREPGDMAILLYTSGTTAHPKGVIVTHGNLLAAIEACNERIPNPDRCPFLQVLPLSHVYGVLMFTLSVAWGFPSVVLPFFDAAKALRAIQDYKIGRTAVVPAILVFLLHVPDREKYDTSSLKVVLSGGGPLPEHVRSEFERVFKCKVNQGYGLSETASITSAYADDEPYRFGSAGRALRDIDVRIVDGEICVRGPAVTPGYWNDPEATREAFCDGWFRTGDIGHLDEDGYLYITDRKKDLIIKGGENISPREIEEVLHQHPAIAEAAVVGIPDETFNENICAVVALRPGMQATEEDIRAHVASSLMKFKAPSRVIFEPALPKNLAGKILKREIRRKLCSGAASSPQ